MVDMPPRSNAPWSYCMLAIHVLIVRSGPLPIPRSFASGLRAIGSRQGLTVSRSRGLPGRDGVDESRLDHAAVEPKSVQDFRRVVHELPCQRGDSSMRSLSSRINDGSQSGLHAHRAAGRHRDHRGADLAAPPRGPGGARGGPADPVHQQPQAARAWGCTITRASPAPSRSTGVVDARPNATALWVGWSGHARVLPLMEQGPHVQLDQLRPRLQPRRQLHGGRDDDLELPLPERDRTPAPPRRAASSTPRRPSRATG